ncbi:alcohol dehydrogenase, partial [Pseudomonas sp. GW456-E7]
VAEQIMSSIEASGLTCSGYGAVIPNPDETSIEEAAEAARSTQVDGIVAVGGGSSIDTAKAVNILLTNPSPIRQYEGSDLVLLNTKPLIAIPTTAGTA